MNQTKQKCPECNSEVSNMDLSVCNNTCPFCGFDFNLIQNRNYLEELQKKHDIKPYHVNLKALGILKKEDCEHDNLNVCAEDRFFVVFCIDCGKILKAGHKN